MVLPQKEAGLRLSEEEEINREVGVAEEEEEEVIQTELVLIGTTVHTKTESTKAKEAVMKQEREIYGLEQNHIDPGLRTEGKGCKYREKEESGAH